MGLISSFLGKDSARAAEQLGQRNAATINNGYGVADGYAKTGFDQSMGYIQPFADASRRGYDMYADSYGINGAEGSSRAYGAYKADPFNAHSNQVASNQLGELFRKYHAQGMGNSGTSALAIGRAGLDAEDRRIADWRGGLGQFANQGVQLAGQQAGMTTGYYDGAANRALGRASALTGNDTQATMAANNARMSGMNNLGSLLGTVGGAAMRYGTGGMGSFFGGGSGGNFQGGEKFQTNGLR